MTETSYAGRRLAVPLHRPYDAAVARFEELIPAFDDERFRSITSWGQAEALAEQRAPMGFMRYWTSDVSGLIIRDPAWKCTEYLMGNHVIAERMYRYDPSVMLYAPLRVVIQADEADDAIFVIDQPSAFFDSFGRPEIAAVGRSLDARVAAVLTALGAEPPAVLRYEGE